MPNGLTQSQRMTLFATIREAAREQGERPEAYRKRILAEELGVDHLSEVSRGSGFDRLMARVCRDAGNDARAIKYSLSAVARYRHLIVKTAERIAPGNALEYVAGVMIQSRTVCDVRHPSLAARLSTDSGWLDLTDPQLRRLLAMLQTHLRRLS